MAEKHERVELEKTLNPANIWAVALGSIIAVSVSYTHLRQRTAGFYSVS